MYVCVRFAFWTYICNLLLEYSSSTYSSSTYSRLPVVVFLLEMDNRNVRQRCNTSVLFKHSQRWSGSRSGADHVITTEWTLLSLLPFLAGLCQYLCRNPACTHYATLLMVQTRQCCATRQLRKSMMKERTHEQKRSNSNVRTYMCTYMYVRRTKHTLQ